MAERLHILDGHGYIFRAHYGLATGGKDRAPVRLSTAAGMPTGALYVYASMLIRLHVDVHPERIIVFGQSLGGALAIHYVAHSPYRSHIRAVIADSPFSDYRLVAQEKLADLFITWPLQWLPTFTVNNDYAPLASVAALAPIPLLLIHGERDGVVGPHHSQALFDAAQEPKALWSIASAGHIGALRESKVRKRLAEFLRAPGAERLAELSDR